MPGCEKTIGRKLVSFETVGSTMDVAAGLAFAGEQEGAVVVAAFQTSGRGRRGNKWIAPRGTNINASIILRPQIPADSVFGLTFVGSLGTASFLSKHYGLPAKVKWPNDVLINYKKIAGVIAEGQLKPQGGLAAAILGIGLNVNWIECPPEVQGIATSIAVEMGKMVDLGECLEGLLASLDETYRKFCEGGLQPVLDEWRKFDCTIGSRVAAIGEGGLSLEGTAVDVTPYGALIIEPPNGQRRVVHAAEIHITQFGG